METLLRVVQATEATAGIVPSGRVAETAEQAGAHIILGLEDSSMELALR